MSVLPATADVFIIGAQKTSSRQSGTDKKSITDGDQSTLSIQRLVPYVTRE
jgi:hypothetical protein